MKILIVIQRSNGDVFLSSHLINSLFEYYHTPQIDLLVNDDTLAITKTLKHIDNILLFSYTQKHENQFAQEKRIIKKIYRKYDLSINLTASDRSVLYAILASPNSISAVEYDGKKSWWKKLFLKHYYYFDTSLPIVVNNSKSLQLLNIEHTINIVSNYKSQAKQTIIDRLKQFKIQDFIIFHPSAQYQYKIYPEHLRNELLKLLSEVGIAIIVTGGNSAIDKHIKQNLPSYPNVYDFIGETSIDEFIALSELSCAYIGMDTLNMHIAASQQKRVFAIFGPTLLAPWSPWSNVLCRNTHTNTPKQTYDMITIFQADMKCVACGLAGCDDNHGESKCLSNIAPHNIFTEFLQWYQHR